MEYFAAFLKSKVDKKVSIDELRRHASLVDIDRDGYIDKHDLETCIGNLNNARFFEDNGAALTNAGFSSDTKFYPKEDMSQERAVEVCRQLRTALITKRISFREAFNRFDSNNDGFLSYAEFSNGLDEIIKFSQPVKEQLFTLMDSNAIGLVDYPGFLEMIQKQHISRSKAKLTDNFEWEMSMLDKLRAWIK